jgi:hypothetical protein
MTISGIRLFIQNGRILSNRTQFYEDAGSFFSDFNISFLSDSDPLELWWQKWLS